MNAEMNRHNMAYLKEETPTQNVFDFNVFYAHKGCIYLIQKYSKNNNILKCYYGLKYLVSIVFVPVIAKLIFSIITPLLQASVPHDPLDIILIC